MLSLLFWLACADVTPDPDGTTPITSDPPTDSPVMPPNLLLVILDDWGIDQFRPYGPPDAPELPFLESVAAEGLLFERFYTHPVCSPTRASLLTGRYAWRNGLYGKLQVLGDKELPLAAVSAAEALAPAGYTSAAIGKWHLGSWNVSNGRHPLLQGFVTHRGPLGNLGEGDASDGRYQTYTDWERLVDGVPAWVTTYATTRQVDDALAVLSALPSPWFGWVALNAPHSPHHAPPSDLLRTPLPARPTERDLYHAMLEAADHELERLLTSLPTDTWVMIVGDNGTADSVSGPWYADRPAKGGLLEGGIRTPFILRGPGLTPGRTDALAADVDLFPTWLTLAGLTPPDGLDGVSLTPVFTDPNARPRAMAFVEIGEPDTGTIPRFVTATDGRFKLFRGADGEALYDFEQRWPEGTPVDLDVAGPEARAAYEALAAYIGRVLAGP